MVNFRALISQDNQTTVIEPRQLFQSLQRDKQLEYLRDVQGDVLDDWHRRREERDLVIKMNTGSGKTLVGLVLLWSKLKEGKGPALYLCPNTYLVTQVQREAEKLGIKYVDFEPDNSFPLEFHDSTAVLITTVQELFNGRSVFRVAGQPDPIRVGAVLIDDAQTCINTAHEQFTARLPKDSIVGRSPFSFFDGALQAQSVGLYADIAQGKRYSYIRVPYWAWQERLYDIAELFSRNQDTDELKFVWSFLRNGEVLSNCTAVCTGDRIEVSPCLLPVNLIPSFDKAEHRVYMSATLVDDSALIKDFAANPESVQAPIKPKVLGDIGERLIVSPTLVDPRIDEFTTPQLISTIQATHQTNVVILVPSRYRARVWEQIGGKIASVGNIADEIDKLTNSEPNTAIFANRYDGIDLPDKACRVLVIDELPEERRLVNLSEVASREGSPILKRHLAQRIEQGMGRGVRSRADYCDVVLNGKRLVSFLGQVDNKTFFTRETRRQIEVGQELCTKLKAESSNSYQAILDLVSQCLNRDPDWQTYHREKVQDTESDDQFQVSNMDLASTELRAWQYAIRSQYNPAAEEIAQLINKVADLSDVDVGWYLQLQAGYLYHVDRVRALEKQLKAHELNPNLLKPPEGISYRRLQAKQTDQAYGVVDWIRKFDEPNALVNEVHRIIQNLEFGIDHDEFEQALHELAFILGFTSQRPDKEANQGPDVLWNLSDSHYLIIEAKNEVSLERAEIYKSEAEQLGHSVTWFKQTYTGATFSPVLVHPAAKLASDAFLPEECKILQPDNLSEIVEAAKGFVTSLANKPPNQWTATDVSPQLAAYSLRPNDFLHKFLRRSAHK